MKRPINVNGVREHFNRITLFITISTMAALLLITNNAGANTNPYYVARSQFTTAINNREPIDHLKQLPANLAVVYYFTELKNLKGRQVTFQWSSNNRNLGKAQFGIGGNRWRLNTRKSVPSGTLFIRLTLDDGTVLLTDSIASHNLDKLTTQSTKKSASQTQTTTPTKPSSTDKVTTQKTNAIDPALKALLGDDIDQATIDQLLNTNNTPTEPVEVISDSLANEATEETIETSTAINTLTAEEAIEIRATTNNTVTEAPTPIEAHAVTNTLSNKANHKHTLTNASVSYQQEKPTASKPPVFVGPTKPTSRSTNKITPIQPSSPNPAMPQNQSVRPVAAKKEKKSHTLVPQTITPEEAIRRAIDRGLNDKGLNSIAPLAPNITAKQPTRQETREQSQQKPTTTLKQDSEKPKAKLIKLD